MSELPTIPGETSTDVLAREYLVLRGRREVLAKEEDSHKKELMEVLADAPSDSRGHVTHTLPAPVGKVVGVQRQRRVSMSLDPDRADEVISAYGLEDRCYETVRVLNEDAILAANYEGLISDDDLASLYVERESFALVLIKD